MSRVMLWTSILKRNSGRFIPCALIKTNDNEEAGIDEVKVELRKAKVCWK